MVCCICLSFSPFVFSLLDNHLSLRSRYFLYVRIRCLAKYPSFLTQSLVFTLSPVSTIFFLSFHIISFSFFSYSLSFSSPSPVTSRSDYRLSESGDCPLLIFCAFMLLLLLPTEWLVSSHRLCSSLRTKHLHQRGEVNVRPTTHGPQ